MVVQYPGGILEKRAEGRFPGDKIIGGDFLAEYVVGRSCPQPVATAFPDEQMTIGDSGVESEGGAGNRLLEGGYDLVRFGRGNVPGGIIPHDDPSLRVAIQENKIAPEGDFIGFERYSHTRRLERSSSLEVESRIVAEQAHVGNVASGLHAGRDCLHGAHESDTGEPVQIGSFSSFKGRPPAQQFERIVTHSVANQNDVFFFHFRQPEVGPSPNWNSRSFLVIFNTDQ